MASVRTTGFKQANSENYRAGRTDPVRFIVVHYTANRGDTAENNAIYFARGPLKDPASAHYFVDEKEVWQSVREGDTAYHCGAKKFKHPECRNENSIGVEMCIWDKDRKLRPVIQVSNTLLRMGLHLLMLPVIVGISYEINRFAGRHDNWFTRMLAAPGMAMQKFTTQEPDDSMIEVAIEALQEVIPEQEGDDKW